MTTYTVKKSSVSVANTKFICSADYGGKNVERQVAQAQTQTQTHTRIHTTHTTHTTNNRERER